MDDESQFLDELFKGECDHSGEKNYIEKIKHTEYNCEDAYMNDEPLFLDELFKDECDYSEKKTCVEDVKSTVSFEKMKLDLSIFTFDEQTYDQSAENMIQDPLIDKSFENFFENEVTRLDESIRDASISYSPPEKIGDTSFEVIIEMSLYSEAIILWTLQLCSVVAINL